jgi:hypothetical protein
MEKKTTFKLKNPVSYLDETITELTLRPIVARDLRAFPVGGAMSFGDFLDIAGNLAGQPKSMVDRLSGEDAMSLVSKISAFLSPGEA